MQRLIIDTDTASDDAVGLIMALREPAVKVELITVVAGNVALEQATINARRSVQEAGTYRPPVVKGVSKPMFRDLITGEKVHGEDGMGDMFLPEPEVPVQPGHAVDAILRCIEQDPSDLELIALGPLTNVALCILQAPQTMKKLKRITVMGGAKPHSSAWHPMAEYNIYIDAEAASIVLNSGIPIQIVQLDVCLNECAFRAEDIDRFNRGGPVAQFCMRCNDSLRVFYEKTWGRSVITLPDPTAVAAAIHPACIAESFPAYVFIETKSPQNYGQMIVDTTHAPKEQYNAVICERLDEKAFKDYLYNLCQ
ncbi:nucleoside hydrolase [Neobittarella massiliensis]|uniref:Nucleoside hydrolase n=1 Tax=Neobittarella massiliensis (ex Bilen et al. 2018) TaxID=2041842 RepID=A0A8J6IR30_9FIRM|nr:nucleoside hydrolase [Neobittarella massiliensis]MBC3516653.1 nucleoside hydrolase [Neobittarella massiliensis]